MSFTLFGLGTALPAARVTQTEGLAVARALGGPEMADAAWLPTVYAHSGIDARHQAIGRPALDDVLNGTRHSGSVFLPTGNSDDMGPTTAERMRVYAAEAPPLAVKAARVALTEARFEPESITQLVTVSCTGFVAPGVDLALIRGLGLRPTVERTHVGFMGCHGVLNGLRVANAFSADPAARVLLCAVELCSLHYYYGRQPDKVVANALFADGAAAAVGQQSDDPARWRVAATGSCLIPDTERAMGWLVGDHGFEMVLSRKIPDLIARNLRPWLEGWLSDNGLSVETVGCWAVHPGGPKVLAAVEEGLRLPREALAASRAVYAECGNMSSPTVLFILDRLRKSNASRPCVMLGFGPGLVAEVALWT
ncbi:MAG TPA: type III polyketide synthase [Gemmataceae bacterium]|jgi:predicted naringenin-chalcone synthase|nr:type III polyketide synthase [Gemmataceae bacterium]